MFQHTLSRLKLAQHFVAILRDTSQTDRVFELVEGVSRDPEIGAKYPPMTAEVDFAREPFEQGFPDLDALRAMPEDSFGRALAAHMDSLGVDFSAFDRKPTPESDYEWLERHGYETHDIWHVVTGWGTGPTNELGLQGFYFGQLDHIKAATLIMLGLMRGFIGGREEMVGIFEAIVAGWQQGRQSKQLWGVDWRLHFERPLAEVRAEFEIQAVDSAAFTEIDEKLAA